MKHLTHTENGIEIDYDDFNYEDPEKNKAYREERWKWERFHLIRAMAAAFIAMGVAAIIVKGLWELIMLIGKIFG